MPLRFLSGVIVRLARVYIYYTTLHLHLVNNQSRGNKALLSIGKQLAKPLELDVCETS